MQWIFMCRVFQIPVVTRDSSPPNDGANELACYIPALPDIQQPDSTSRSGRRACSNVVYSSQKPALSVVFKQLGGVFPKARQRAGKHKRKSPSARPRFPDAGGSRWPPRHGPVPLHPPLPTSLKTDGCGDSHTPTAAAEGLAGDRGHGWRPSLLPLTAARWRPSPPPQEQSGSAGSASLPVGAGVRGRPRHLWCLWRRFCCALYAHPLVAEALAILPATPQTRRHTESFFGQSHVARSSVAPLARASAANFIEI